MFKWKELGDGSGKNNTIKKALDFRPIEYVSFQRDRSMEKPKTAVTDGEPLVPSLAPALTGLGMTRRGFSPMDECGGSR